MRLFITIAAVCALLIGSLFLDRPHPRAELVAGYISIETLDAQLARASEDIRVAYALFEGLCTIDPYTFTVEPGVAESWDISPDGTTYTFHLRNNVKWSNGDAITAGDFAFAWRLGLMPDTAPPYIEFLQYIRGGKAFTSWCIEKLARVQQMTDPLAQLAAAKRRVDESQRKFADLVGVRVIDDRTLEVQIERPMPYFLEIITTWPLVPLHRPTIEAVTTLNPDSLMLRRDPLWTRPDVIVNNGPYRLVESRFKRFIRLEANPHYWAAARVGPRTVELISFNDPTAWFNGYSTGVADVMFDAQYLTALAPELIADAHAGKRDDLIEIDGFATYYYCFNTRPNLPGGAPNPFTDSRIRRAFAICIDKRALVNEVTRLRQRTAGTFVPPGTIPGYDSPGGVIHDPDRARRELAAAGYPGGRGLPLIELSFNSNAGHELTAQAIARMWERELGVQVTTEPQEWKVYLSRRIAGDFMVCRSAWTGDYQDPTTFLDLFRTDNGNNDAGYANPRYDAMLDTAAAEQDPAKRMSLLSEAEKFLLEEEAALCPLYHYKFLNLHKPWVEGVNDHPRDFQFFHLMRILPR